MRAYLDVAVSLKRNWTDSEYSSSSTSLGLMSCILRTAKAADRRIRAFLSVTIYFSEAISMGTASGMRRRGRAFKACQRVEVLKLVRSLMMGAMARRRTSPWVLCKRA